MLTAWNPVLPVPSDTARVAWGPPFSRMAPQRLSPTREVPANGRGAILSARPAAPSPAAVVADGRGSAEIPGPGEGSDADRRALGLALAAHFLSPTMAGSGQVGGDTILSGGAAEDVMPGRGKPFRAQRDMAGWSLGGWLYLRDASVSAPGGIGAASQLGASQGGVRIAYGFGKTGRLRAYGRTTAAVRQPQQREQAFGLAFAPVGHWPVDIAVEQRVKVGREGRTALAAMMTGGVSGVALPGDFRLDAYGQAGVVGARQRDRFADGAVVIDRRLGPDEDARLRFGAFVAGAIQPGAARVDVGPRLTLRLPHVGEGSRVALEWRQRIAGDADPESGVALSLASDF